MKHTVTIVQAEPTGLEYAISGCCDDLRKKARKAIDDLLGTGTPAEVNADSGGGVADPYYIETLGQICFAIARNKRDR